MQRMPTTVRSFAKINLGLHIGRARPDAFHELRTVYQTIALHDVIHVSVGRGQGTEIQCDDPRVPTDATNTCYRIVERAMQSLGMNLRVTIKIDKQLPVQGGLGGASGNAVAALLAFERAAKKRLTVAERLRIAAEVGSDLPLFLIGGTVLGVGRGEEVYPLPDLPSFPCVVALPEIGVSTPQAFKDWDANPATPGSKLTLPPTSDRMIELSPAVSAWLGGLPQNLSGVPGSRSRGRAETLLLDLVRTGIENDFEQVVFPKHPELREVKRVLLDAGAAYASLSGSGSAVYGLFRSRSAAEKGCAKLQRKGVPAVVTRTLTRAQYWRKFPVSGF
jgi:4-diphosphocytidyl-2-C-methyl-D-erythritol kinase